MSQITVDRPADAQRGVPPPTPGRSPSAFAGAEVIFGALAAAAVAHLALVLAVGGYDIQPYGIHIRASALGRPLAIAVAFLFVRWIASLWRTGLARSPRAFLPIGPVAGAVGVAILVFVALSQARPAPAHVIAIVAGAALAGFVFAWLSYGRAYPATARAVVFVTFILVAAALGDSLAYPKKWSKTFGLSEKEYVASVTAADRQGLLMADGSGVAFEKVNLSGDWRDAAVISPGGYYAARFTPSTAGTAALAFAVAGRGAVSGGTVRVSITAGTAGPKTDVLYTAAASALSGAWQEVRVPMSAARAGEYTFEFEGTAGGGTGTVLIANPRIAPDGPAAPAAAASARPNVLLVVVDCLRADRLGLYGYSRPTTPNIDKLAASAVTFEDCVAAAPWTLPSMGSVFTSLSPTAHGLVDSNAGLAPSLRTFTESLRDAGYFAGAVQANTIFVPEIGVAQGFNQYNTLASSALLGARGAHARGDAVTDAAISWLDANSTSPFFLYVHYMDLHTPFCDAPGMERFGKGDSDIYDGQMAYVDSQFARLMARLEAGGLRENTIVVFTSDHGEQFMEHGMTGHGNDLHHEELEVPLVVWAPTGTGATGAGGKAARRVSERVRGIDIAPTVLALTGAEALSDAEGETFAGVFSGQPIKPRPAISELVTFKTARQQIISITDGPYRSIVTEPLGSRRYEIFDMAADRAEYANLAARAEPVVRDVEEKVLAHLRAAQALHAQLVPVEAAPVMSEERRAALAANGYVSKGADGPPQ